MKCWVFVLVVSVLLGVLGDSWAAEYIDMCPCLPVNMCRGVFRASHEDQMYFSRVLRCPDETHTRCCTFQVTVAAEKTTRSGNQEEAMTTESVLSETTESATENASTEELETEDSRFDRDESTTETPTSTIENRENVDGVLVIYPTEVSKISSNRSMRTFEGDQPEDELVLIFPAESSRETRATTSDEPNLTTPEAPKVKKYKYNNVTRKRFMPILKINESHSEIYSSDAKPIFKVANSENRRFLEELYKNRTRFGIPASQITTSSSPKESEILKNEVIPEEELRKPTQRPTPQPKRTLYYDPTKRKSFLKKNVSTEATTTKQMDDPSTKHAVDSNHREMIEEVLSELKKETNSLVMPKEIVVNPSIVAKISNMQKRLIEKIVDKISTKIEQRDDIEELTATIKLEQSRPFRGSLRYVDTLRNPRESTSPSSVTRVRQEGGDPAKSEPKKRKSKNPRRKSSESEFTGEISLPIDFRPSPLWTLQRGEDPYPVPQVPLLGSVRESRDIVPENFSWRQRGFVPIPQIPRTTPIQIIGPIPKGFTHDSSRHSTPPSDLPSENAPPHFRRFTGKVFSK